MFKLFAFNFFNEYNTNEFITMFKGFALGLFIVNPIYRSSDCYGRGMYSDHSLNHLSWIQKFLNRKEISEYKAYLKGEFEPEDLGRGEWCGICPIGIRFPFLIHVEANYHQTKNDIWLSYSAYNSKDRWNKILIKNLFGKKETFIVRGV
jgi:hypothetical protein